jgi:hypothetical protein
MPKVDTVLKQLMEELDIQAPLEEFKMGIEVEKEHTKAGLKDGVYSVIPMKLLPIAKIAAAHLAELPDYYTRLKKMEEEGKKHVSASKKQAEANPRELLFNLLGLNEANKIWDTFAPKKKEPLKDPEKKKPDEEEIDDDFFASTMGSEMFGDEEEAISPDDIVRKPVEPVTAAENTRPQLKKLRDQMHTTLHYLVNKALIEAKGDAKKFKSLRELRDSLKDSLLTLENTLEEMK